MEPGVENITDAAALLHLENSAEAWSHDYRVA